MKNLFLLASLMLATLLSAQPELALDPLPTTFATPLAITAAGDGTDEIYVGERSGTVQRYNTETGAKVEILNISGQVDARGEGGLLGIAFHPGFPTQPYFYLNYTTPSSVEDSYFKSRISRFTVGAGSTANPASELVIIEVEQPLRNHNGGDLAFGPDGFLYIPFGDGGGALRGNSQDPSLLLGKILRLDVDNPSGGRNYGIPAGNPYVGNAGILDEIFAFGLRNPYRFSFDRATGDQWIADVGQSRREEVNLIEAGSNGQNFGWNCREGLIAYNGSPRTFCGEDAGPFDDPVFDYPHTDSGNGIFGQSITGGYVYRGPVDELQGYYVCADYRSGNFILFQPSTQQLTADDGLPASSVSTFGEGNDGRLYVAGIGGAVYEVTTAAALPVTLTEWKATAYEKYVGLAWTTSRETGARDFVVERSQDGKVFSPLLTEVARGGAAGATYTTQDAEPIAGTNYYRLRQRDLDGREELFGMIAVEYGTEPGKIRIYPNPTSRLLQLVLPTDYATTFILRLQTAEGRVVMERKVFAGGGSTIPVTLPNLKSGVYTLILEHEAGTETRRVVIRE